ncbi:PREDICTED: EKC/KEOPS complex subunit LAGE3-like isoform X2 [Chinchilla lanigera]|uniref:EKC/KEOPS complex subunit LAGE3-like isoform X2 n=1 Tax=Chinchilla lanigera TaxID=34839 RepID=UPI00038F0BF1|nr:PREDICTED: EKC/KEOPS complex subunit LAGE3-like isoform X2 [Chinchilla lanigera]
MQAPGGGAGGAEGNKDDQRGASVSGGAGAHIRTFSQVVQIPQGPWPFGQIVLVGSTTGPQHYEYLRVPFRSPIAAEVIRTSLATFGENLDVPRVLSVAGRILTVRWVAQDQGQLQAVFNAFLNDLSMLLRTMRRFGPPFPLESLPGKGG